MNVLRQQHFMQLAHLVIKTNWLMVIRHLQHSNELSFTLWQSLLAIRQCVRFLMLVLQYPNTCLVPNKEIDAVIHLLEQHSSFNRYFEHQPGLGTQGEIDRHNWLKAFQATRKLFESHFDNSMERMNEQPALVISLFQPAACEVCLRVGRTPIQI